MIVQFGDYITQLAHSGFPITLVMKQNEIQHFRYYHYSPNGFRVLFSKMFGKARIAVNAVPLDADYEYYKPDFANKDKIIALSSAN